MRAEDVVRAFSEAFNAGDVERMEELCTDDTEIVGLRAAVEGTRYVGPDAVRRFWADATDIWSELHFDIDETRVRGDTLVGVGRFRARGRQSGVVVDERIGARVHIRDGRIVSFRTLVDPAEAE
jgi:ketosteroid isomerase-like protein